MRNYKSKTCKTNLGTNKNHLQGKCIHGRYVNGTRQPNLYKFALEKPPGYQMELQFIDYIKKFLDSF